MAYGWNTKRKTTCERPILASRKQAPVFCLNNDYTGGLNNLFYTSKIFAKEERLSTLRFMPLKNLNFPAAGIGY